MRSEYLVESAPPKIVRLSLLEAQALIELGKQLRSTKLWWGDDAALDDDRRSAIRCEPAGEDSWAVGVNNAVGVISTDNLQLIVRPKVPVAHLLHLFALSGTWPRLHDAKAWLAAGLHLHELVVEWFLGSAEALLRAGLLSDYREIADDLDAVRGTILPLETSHLYYSGRLSATCTFEEFDVDTPLNRVVKAAAREIVKNPALGPGRRHRAERVVLRMDEVGELQPTDPQVDIDRRTHGYADVVKLARQVLAGAGRALSGGGVRSRAFLIPTPDLVEEGIRQVLRQALRHDVGLSKQGKQLPGSTLTINPDLVFDRFAVGDVKYKVDWSAWPRSDLYQSVAFATAFYRLEAVVVSVGVSSPHPLATVHVGPVRVQHLVWPALEALDPLNAQEELGNAARVWWHGVANAEAAA